MAPAVRRRRQQAPLDAELVHRAGEAEAVHQHADRADDECLVGIDLVSRNRDVVGARRTRFLDHRVDLPAVQRLQPHDLVVQHAGLHQAAAGRVEPENHGLRTGVLEGDLAAHPGQREVRAAAHGGVVASGRQPEDQHRCEQQPREPKEDAPAPFAASIVAIAAGNLLCDGVPATRPGRRTRHARPARMAAPASVRLRNGSWAVAQ